MNPAEHQEKPNSEGQGKEGGSSRNTTKIRFKFRKGSRGKDYSGDGVRKKILLHGWHDTDLKKNAWEAKSEPIKGRAQGAQRGCSRTSPTGTPTSTKEGGASEKEA